MALAKAELPHTPSLAVAPSARLANLLFGVTPHDPVVLFTIPALLTAVGLAAAALVPALRAVRIQPIVALERTSWSLSQPGHPRV